VARLRKLTDAQVYAIRSEYVPYCPENNATKVAKRHGITPDSVRYLAGGNTYKNVPHPDKASKPKFSLRKLTDDQAHAIRLRYVRASHTHGIKAMARQYDVNPDCIRDIVRGYRYKNVPFPK
jgi:hypothetical protein